MNKKLVALAVFGLIALTACNQSKSTEETKPEVSTEQVAQEADTAAQAIESVPPSDTPTESSESPKPTTQDPNSAEAKAGEDQQY